MAFTGAMRAWLGRMSVCVIGVSGTGSVVAEQLARLGVGEIILIDFDKLEERNLNRILNASPADIGAYKVEMFAAAIRRYRSIARSCRCRVQSQRMRRFWPHPKPMCFLPASMALKAATSRIG